MAVSVDVLWPVVGLATISIAILMRYKKFMQNWKKNPMQMPLKTHFTTLQFIEIEIHPLEHHQRQSIMFLAISCRKENDEKKPEW